MRLINTEMNHRQTNYEPNNLENPILIGDAAAWLKVSVKTLRRWEDHGLINPQRNSLNQRLYSPDELKSLRDRKHKPINVNQVESYLTISEVAEMLQVTVKTIRRWG
jgi:DNA-binding transcriptional MerR regulator